MGRKLSGFTLIELLIVVAIIAILAAIAVPNFLEAQTRAKISRAKGDMRSLSVALQAYRVDNEQYPPDVDSGAYPAIHNYWRDEIASYHYLTTPVSYMTSIPRDPFFLSQGGTPQGVAAKDTAYFEYSEDSLEDARNPTKAAQLHASNCGFVMVCMGPDRFGAFDWSGTNWLKVGNNDGSATVNKAPKGLQYLCYDPTNGTVSDGDIICTAKGFYGGGGR